MLLLIKWGLYFSTKAFFWPVCYLHIQLTHTAKYCVCVHVQACICVISCVWDVLQDHRDGWNATLSGSVFHLGDVETGLFAAPCYLHRLKAKCR